MLLSGTRTGCQRAGLFSVPSLTSPPAPSDNMHGCRRVELKYDSGLRSPVSGTRLPHGPRHSTAVQNLSALLDTTLRTHFPAVWCSSHSVLTSPPETFSGRRGPRRGVTATLGLLSEPFRSSKRRWYRRCRNQQMIHSESQKHSSKTSLF